MINRAERLPHRDNQLRKEHCTTNEKTFLSEMFLFNASCRFLTNSDKIVISKSVFHLSGVYFGRCPSGNSDRRLFRAGQVFGECQQTNGLSFNELCSALFDAGGGPVHIAIHKNMLPDIEWTRRRFF